MVVGNETLLRKDLTVPQLLDAIQTVQARGHRPGLHRRALACLARASRNSPTAVDVITIHLLPYWEGLPADAALASCWPSWIEVQAAYPGKKIVIGEVGWPSDGITVGAAKAGRIAQAQVMRSFLAAAQARGIDYFVMEAFDQPWKTSFEGRAAGYWGLYDLDRHAKWPMQGPVLGESRTGRSGPGSASALATAAGVAAAVAAAGHPADRQAAAGRAGAGLRRRAGLRAADDQPDLSAGYDGAGLGRAGSGAGAAAGAC